MDDTPDPRSSMLCPQMRLLVSGSPTDPAGATLGAHLEGCLVCRTVLEEWAKKNARLQAASKAQPMDTGTILEAIKERLAEETRLRVRVLVVDDDAHMRSTVMALLASEYEVVSAEGVDQAQEILASRPIDILLTDQRMPGRTGVQLLEWAREHTPRTIRLLMTGYSELEDAVDAINRGNVYYYLLKPWHGDDLYQVMRNAADKFRLEREREDYFRLIQDMNRELERRVKVRTGELEEANQLLVQRARELERLALTDPLTGLLNRRAMDELARFELKRHARYPSPLTIGYVDVDHFKMVNTRHLLTGGDAVLRELARLLTSTIREVDSVGRVGGEEFLILARETGIDGAQVLGERIRSAVEALVVHHGDAEIRITVSVGIAVAEVGVPAEYEGMTQLAASALSAAKEGGRNRCEVRSVAAR